MRTDDTSRWDSEATVVESVPLRPAAARRRATAGARMKDAPPRPRATAAPRYATAVVPAVAADPDAAAPARSTSGRTTARMRRVRPEETALVECTTQILQVVERMDEQALVPLDDAPGPREPVTIVPRATGSPVVVWQPPRKIAGKPRSWASAGTVWGLGVVMIVGVLLALSPLAGSAVQHVFAPRGAQLAGNRILAAPTGPWDTSAGAQNALGIGGGAGPGVKAPGSAGLPVRTTAAPKPAPAPPAPAPPAPAPPAPAPAPPSEGGVSPAPVQPWPPANAYMAVPDHPGFAVSEPNPDSYWWAFGQCTWWAQRQRPDENLTRMGNAQYWAGGAAARGYYVSSVPRANTTVVFQPGVQGAGGAGHVAHVIAVYPGGWFLVSEMNFYWNGGGWARVDYRYAHMGSGVMFIY
jgi:CHAP domain-containing protein